MKTTLSLIAATALSLVSGTLSADKGNSFIDYARVTHIEPIYHYVTVRTPQRSCEPIRRNHHRPSNHHRPNHHRPNHHRTNHHRRDLGRPRQQPAQRLRQQRQNQHRSGLHVDTASAVIVGGVIGGTIGNHITNSNNNRNNNLLGTLAGALIGSGLAHEAARQQQRDSNNHTLRVSNVQGHNGHSTQHGHRLHHRQRDHHRSHNRRQHCVTTTVSSRERRQDGYRVTYMYRGHTYHTRTEHDPGHRLAIRVQINPR